MTKREGKEEGEYEHWPEDEIWTHKACMHCDVTRQCIGRGAKYFKSRVILLVSWQVSPGVGGYHPPCVFKLKGH